MKAIVVSVASLIIFSACSSDSPKASVKTGAEPASFDDSSIDVDNEFFPLVPGTQDTLEGTDLVDGEKTPHRVVFTVTDLVKEIGGINAVVVWERDFVDDQLEEAELAFFAQDTDGNVWHLGEYTEAYEDGELLGGQAWLAGHLKGAKAGILMPADPQAGTPSFAEGFAPAPFNWDDRGQIYKIGETTRTPAGSYDDVVVAKEFSSSEPGAIQLKYYASGIGNVRIGWMGDDTQQENLALVSHVRLKGADLDAARSGALELEERANVYGSTPPAQRRQSG